MMTTAPFIALGELLLATAVAAIFLVCRVAVITIVNLMHRSAILKALQSSARRAHWRRCPPPPGQMCGGGPADEEEKIHVHATQIASALRQLGEQVNAPGLKAIHAVLLVNHGDRQVMPPITQARR